MRDLILGIDPGVSGALALFNPLTDKLVNTYAMPSTEAEKKKRFNTTGGRKVDPVGLGELVHALSPRISFAVIELVGARPGQGVVSTFNFGFFTGIVHGVLASAKIPTHVVRPDVWKTLTGVTKDKKTSLALATKLFPEFESHWPNAAQSGHAEAAILAHFGKRFMGLTPKKTETGHRLSEFAERILS